MIKIPKRNLQSTHVFHQYTLKIVGDASTSNFRDNLRKALSEKGIPSMVYYPIGLHKQKAFEKYHSDGDTFPVSDMLCISVLSLPMHTEMTDEMVDIICKEILSLI
jgi:UDP-2-acetamido-2-deoxy-ribo-hexuluronate aminotransferase